ncbi:MAG: hypothetical protein RR413_12370 [Christensenellaceae bacterium]
MKISMYDVNFGECILYEEDSKQLLVDCGAKYGKAGALACAQVQKDLGNNADLMITHFDEDHYNGIIEMPKGTTFKTVYLPLYIWHNGEANTTAKVFIDTIKSLAYLFIMGKPKLSVLQKLFVKLPELVTHITDIKCIGAGEKIIMGTHQFDVLWPEEKPAILGRRSAVCYSEELINILFEEEYLFAKEAKNAAEEYVNAFVSLYSFYVKSETSNDIIDETPYDFGESTDGSPLIEQWKKLQFNFVAAYENLKQFKSEPLSPPMKARVNAIFGSLIKGMNACSIVWHNDICLACGDITPGVMSYLQPKLQHFYQLIKVSHHGTKSYFTHNLPNAGIYIISNNGSYRTNWGIDERYPTRYNCCCTNNNDARCCVYRRCRHCNDHITQPARIFCVCSDGCCVVT